MTLFNDAAAQASILNAPALPEDKARASELWESVKGTHLEQAYRDVSQAHPQKNQNRTAYLAFLADIEALFVVPEAAATPLPVEEQDAWLAEEARAEDEAESRMEEDANAPTPVLENLDPGDGEDDLGDEDNESDPELEDEGEGETPDTPATPEVPAPAQPEPPAPVQVQTLTAPPQDSGLFGQLAGMLADGGQLTLQLMRVGDQLTVGIFPQPNPGEAAAQPLALTESPEWLDMNLIPAMQGYAQARRDAFAVCQEAAKKQQAANKKTAEAKPTPSAAAKTPSKGPRTFAVTLQAAEGTTFSATQSGKDVALVIGENQVTQGSLEITASHPVFGDVKKTLTVYAAKTHDFREQQGGRVRVEVTPESAALTATKGDITLALHGETLLPTGKWTITAEAADHETATQSVTVKAGKAEVIQMALKETEMGSLF